MGQRVGAVYSPPASPHGGMAASLIRFREATETDADGREARARQGQGSRGLFWIGPRLKGIVCASTSAERLRACNRKRECGSCYRPWSSTRFLSVNSCQQILTGKHVGGGKPASPNYFPPFWIAVSQRYKQTLLRKSGRTCLLVSLILVSANHR